MHHMKVSRVLPVLGYSLAFFASSVMCSVLHRDFTLKNMITPAVLDAQMNFVSLLLITMSVPGCITSFILETCYDIATKNRLLHDLITRVFFKNLEMESWYWASLTLLVMPIISIAKIPRILENFLSASKGSLYHGYHSAYAHA